MSKALRNDATHQNQPRSWRAPLLLGAGALAASYLFVRSKTRQAERENPPAGKFVEVDGIRLHYVEHGRGPALVLLHGNGVLANDFDTSGVALRAAERYRVISFDRPGYGYSERPRTTIWTPAAQARLLHKALRQIGIDNPVVMGHSWGTLVALSMALEFPAYVRGLVLLSGYYYPSMRLEVPLFAQPAIPLLGDLLRFTVSPLLSRLMWPMMSRTLFSPLAVPERFRRLPVWMMLRPSQLRASAAESAMMVPAVMQLRKHYPELTVPVKIIAGRDDRFVDARHNSARLREAVPNSDLRLEPGVGHMIHYAAVDDIVAAVDELAAVPETPKAPRGRRAAKAVEQAPGTAR